MSIPPYLVTISIVSLIFTTVLAFLLRLGLYQHLKKLELKTRRLLKGERPPELPLLIENIEQRLQQDHLEWAKLNTNALIKSVYSQEKFRFLAFTLGCESVNYFSQICPLIILAFGLTITIILISLNLGQLQSIIFNLDLNDLRSILETLEKPFREIGLISLITLVAIISSSLLVLINLAWNTSQAKTTLLYCLADYLDNIYLAHYNNYNPIEETIERLVLSLTVSLEKLLDNLQTTLALNLGEPLQQLTEDNAKIMAMAEDVSTILTEAIKVIKNIDNSVGIFDNAVKSLEQSRFAEKLTSATTDLAIAQSQYSQSSLVLNKSTQSLEYTLDAIQKFMPKLIDLNGEIKSLNEKYATVVTLSQKRNVIEEAGLNQIKNELTNLVERLRK